MKDERADLPEASAEASPTRAGDVPPADDERDPAALAEAWTDVEPDFGGARPFLLLDGLRVERGLPEQAFVLEIDRLRIPAGSFTALLGGSGIGKTTLLTVLGLLRGPGEGANLRMRCKRFVLGGEGDDGVVVYRDLDENQAGVELSAAEREGLRREWIGFCLQGGELVPALTLADNSEVPAHLCRLPDAARRAERHLRSLGMVDSAMGNQLGKLPGELSGGQRQRGVVARALVHSPRMVLLDEPTAALDRGTAEEAIDLLRKLAREHGQTVIMVTHDRALAEKYADYLIELDLVKKRHSRIKRCRARLVDVARPGAPPPEGAAARPTSFGYHVRLGLLDALGPLFHALPGGRRGRERPRVGVAGLRFAFQLVQNSAVVVAIAMLVLFLRGMRSGLIEDFRMALRKSPTARKIAVFGDFTPPDIERIRATHPRIETVVPVATPLVGLTGVDDESGPDASTPLAKVTLNGLVRGDPTSRSLGRDIDFLDAMEPDHIVLAERAAEALGVGKGDSVRMWALRFRDEHQEEPDPASTVLRVYDILEGEARRIGTAWVHFSLTQAISRFKLGLPVETKTIDWPGQVLEITPRYAAFLLFVRSDEPGEEALLRSDRDLLDRKSFSVELLGAGDRELLGAILKTPEQLAAAGEAHKPLTVFRCVSQRGDPLRASELDVENELRGGGLLMPWNEPLLADLGDGRPIRVVGCSFQRAANWLLPYLKEDLYVFKWHESGWSIVVADEESDSGPRALVVQRDGDRIELALDGRSLPPATDVPVGMVPSRLLSGLRALASGEASVDRERQVIFRKKAREEYGRVHVFPDDVFAVPEITRALIDAGFQATARMNELREIQGYTRVLGYIVRVTSILAGIIAFLTIAIVFHEVGRSKKRVLATLRIMGLTQRGAFILLMVRGVLVAVIAGCLMLLVGSLGSAALNALTGRDLCILGAADYLLVLLGVFAVCVAGTYVPARSVSRTEPVVALQEAEQQ